MHACVVSVYQALKKRESLGTRLIPVQQSYIIYRNDDHTLCFSRECADVVQIYLDRYAVGYNITLN